MTDPDRQEKKYRRANARLEHLCAQINTLAPILMNQGDLVLKRIGAKRYYYLRFLLPEDQRGQRRHCSLYVGRESDQELVARIRDLLEHIREPRQQIEEIARYVQITKMMRCALQAAARELGTSDANLGSVKNSLP